MIVILLWKLCIQKYVTNILAQGSIIFHAIVNWIEAKSNDYVHKPMPDKNSLVPTPKYTAIHLGMLQGCQVPQSQMLEVELKVWLWRCTSTVILPTPWHAKFKRYQHN